MKKKSLLIKIAIIVTFSLTVQVVIGEAQHADVKGDSEKPVIGYYEVENLPYELKKM